MNEVSQIVFILDMVDFQPIPNILIYVHQKQWGQAGRQP